MAIVLLELLISKSRTIKKWIFSSSHLEQQNKRGNGGGGKLQASGLQISAPLGTAFGDFLI
jgi:hypothetical protein